MKTIDELYRENREDTSPRWSPPREDIAMADKLVFSWEAMEAIRIGSLFANLWDANAVKKEANAALMKTIRHARETKAKKGELLPYTFRISPTDAVELVADGSTSTIVIKTK